MDECIWTDSKPYGRIGPYGELMWDTLSEFKSVFLKKIFSYQEHNKSKFIDHILHMIEEARWYLKKSEFIFETNHPFSYLKALNYYTEKVCIHSQYRGLSIEEFSEHRLKDLDKFLSDQSDFLKKSIHDKSIALADLVAPFISTYYFCRPFPETNDDCLVTWLPSFEYMSASFARKSKLDGKVAIGRAVYPTITMHLGDESHISRFLSYTLSIGDFDGSGKSDIGHIQSFNRNATNDMLLPDLLSYANPRARWSDLFYFNRSGARFVFSNDDCQHTKGEITGCLYLCSPFKGLFEIMAGIAHQGGQYPVPKYDYDLSQPIDSLSNLVRLSWESVGGDFKSEALIKHLQVTKRDLFSTNIKEKVIKSKHNSLLFSFGHHIGGIFQESGLACINDPGVVSRLRLAWGFADVTRLVKYEGKALPTDWFSNRSFLDNYTKIDAQKALVKICQYYLCGQLESACESYVVQWELPWGSQVMTLKELQNKREINMPTLPPLADDARRRPGTQAVTMGLAELIRNAANAILSIQKISDVPQAVIQINITDHGDTIYVSVANYHEGRVGNLDPSRSVNRLREIEEHLLTIKNTRICETSHAIAIETTQSGHAFCSALWSFNFNTMMDEYNRLKKERCLYA